VKRIEDDAVKAFLMGHTIYSYNADTRLLGATITYQPDGTCTAEMADGSQDKGVWGLKGDTYWTRYDRFRDGTTNAFYLIEIAPQVMQAYFDDGRTAFIQTPLTTLPEDVK
jgi:hypothetical protein